MYLYAKVPEVNCNRCEEKLNKKRYVVINIIHRLLILTYYYNLKWVYITQNVHSLWVCLRPEVVFKIGPLSNQGHNVHSGILILEYIS